MAKELPYFKFEPSEWDNGNIQMCSKESKGLFIDLCSMYWSRLGEMPYALALQKHCNGSKDALQDLENNEIIRVEDGQIIIEFLDEQLDEFQKTSEKRRMAANKRWSDASALQVHSKSNAIRVDKKKEDKSRVDKKKEQVTKNKEQVNEICNFAWSLFPEDVRPEKNDIKEMNRWRDSMEKLIRIDGKEPTEIKKVVAWARKDEWWQSRFLSPLKLRKKNKDGIKYYDYFNENRKNGNHRTKIDTKTISDFDPDSYSDFKVAGASDRSSDEGSRS